MALALDPGQRSNRHGRQVMAMSSALVETPTEARKVGRRTGYVIAIVVDLVLLFAVQNILEWGWFPFLTDDFSEIVPWVSFSLLLGAAANVIYMIDDRTMVKSSGQIALNVVNVIVTYQILRVFPFDFSDYDFNWGMVTRIVLILAMVGAGIGALAETAKLASAVRARERR